MFRLLTHGFDDILTTNYSYELEAVARGNKKLSKKLKEELNRKGNQYKKLQLSNEPIEFDSWIDSFILGDVHMLGFSFDFSEFDLWWLLNRRFNETAEKGKFYFYDSGDTDDEKMALLKLLGVEVISFQDFSNVPKDNSERTLYYQNFFRYAIEHICKKTQK